MANIINKVAYFFRHNIAPSYLRETSISFAIEYNLIPGEEFDCQYFNFCFEVV